MMKTPEKKSWAWMAVVFWTASIYLVIPLARAIQHGVDRTVGRQAFLYLVALSILAGLGFAWRHLPALAGTRLGWRRVVLLAVAALFAAGTWSLRGNPEEAMHFVQYGVLSLLLFRALRMHCPDPGLYGVAFLMGSIVGVVDELIQWVMPGRYFDFRDIGINVAAVALVQMALAWGIQPQGIAAPVRAATARMGLRLATTLALLLTVMLSATPGRISRMAYPGFLHGIDEPMIEYGYAIRDPSGLVFKSRLPGTDLPLVDRVRAEEAGALLKDFSGEDGYRSFLAQFPPVRDPFVHELRVHQFRRDRYWNLARAQRPNPVEHSRLITISFREQEILEKYFGQTLKASGQDWPPDLRERARSAVIPGRYVSPVSQGLVTFAPERIVRMIPLAGLMAFAALLAYARIRRWVL